MTSHALYRQLNKDYAYWTEKRRFGQKKGGHVSGLLTLIGDEGVRLNLLFDCGLGTLEALADLCDEIGEPAFWDVPLVVFITHGHIDHHAELMVLSEIYCQRRDGDLLHNARPPVPVHCTAETQEHLYNTHRWGFTGGGTLLHQSITPGNAVNAGPFAVHPLAVNHCPGSVIFAVTFGPGPRHKIVIGWDLRSPPMSREHLSVLRAPSLALIEGATWTPMADLTGHAGIQALADSGFFARLDLEYAPTLQRYGAYWVHYAGLEDPGGALSDGDLELHFHAAYPHLKPVFRVAQRLQTWRFDL